MPVVSGGYLLKEILDYILVEERIDTFFAILAWAAPLAGILLGAFVGLFKKPAVHQALRGFIFGLGGTVIFFLWKLFLVIVNHYGIDSVKGLLINLLIFTVTGIVLGLGWRWANRHPLIGGNNR